MKILLMQQDTGQRGSAQPLYPIGLSYLAAVLADHDVRVFDPNLYDYPACLEYLRQAVADFQPDLVGISIRNVDTTQRRDLFVNFKTVKPALAVVREIKPDTVIVAGGAGFSIHAREIMETLPEIDYGVYLEGEESFPELLSSLQAPEKVKGLFYRRDSKVLFSGPRQEPNFKELPKPRRDKALIDITRYRGPFHDLIGVQSKRGCVYSCSYCTYVFLNQRGVRLRDPVRVVDEIEQLVNEYGVKGFTFVDSLFNMPESHARAICEEMIRRKIDVVWGAWLTPLNISEEFLRLMREAGCRHIGYSPDAVTEKGLKVLQKGFSLKDLEKSIQLAKKIKGVSFGYGFFCSYPGMTIFEPLKILWMLFRIPLALPGRGSVVLGWIRVEPWTDIFNRAVKEGVMPEDVKMLPENEKELAGLFYVPKNQWVQTRLFDMVLFLVDGFLKPLVKQSFRWAAQLKKHKAFYDR